MPNAPTKPQLEAVLEYFSTAVGPLLALAEYNFACPSARKVCQQTRDGGRVVTTENLKARPRYRHPSSRGARTLSARGGFPFPLSSLSKLTAPAAAVPPRRVTRSLPAQKQYALQGIYSAINQHVHGNNNSCRRVASGFGPRQFQKPDGSLVLASEALHGRECPLEETLQALKASANAQLKHVKETEAKLTLTSARAGSAKRPPRGLLLSSACSVCPLPLHAISPLTRVPILSSSPAGPLSAVESAWVQNLTDFSLALLEFVARAHSLLSQLLFAPFEFYVKVMVGQVMGASERAAACFEMRLLERIRWMVRFAENSGCVCFASALFAPLLCVCAHACWPENPPQEAHLASRHDSSASDLSSGGGGLSASDPVSSAGDGAVCGGGRAGHSNEADTSLLVWDALRLGEDGGDAGGPGLLNGSGGGVLVSQDA